MTAHVFLNNKTEDGEFQEIEILGVDTISMNEFYLNIYGNIKNEENIISLPLIGSFISSDVVGYYLEDL